MGAACCVAAKDKTVPNIVIGGNLHRNAICSPSWSRRWENRRRVAGEIDNSSYRLSNGVSSNIGGDGKGGEISLGIGSHSYGESPVENLETPTLQSPPIHQGICSDQMASSSDPSIAGDHHSPEVNVNRFEQNLVEEKAEFVKTNLLISKSMEPDLVEDTIFVPPKLLVSIPSTSSSSAQAPEPLPSQNTSHTVNSTPSRRPRMSPGHQLFRQVSDGQILGLKSSNNNSISEGRPSSVLSTGSPGGPSDGWSMRTFTELVASCQKERLSFDSEHLGSSRRKISVSSSRFSYSPSIDMSCCCSCNKPVMGESLCSSNKVAVVSVLACGHAYHAECLEVVTVDADRFDPPCPVCATGEKHGFKMPVKAALRNKDSFSESDFCVQKQGKVGKMDASSSSSANNSVKPFLRRHFSLGSKWGRSLSDNDTERKRGFWARRRKD